jgi:DNA-binding NtrC family response regulator
VKGRVLVVDDEKNMGMVIGAMLERAGYETVVHEDPKAAVESIRARGFDVIITDLNMPSIDGLEMLRTAGRLQPDVPVILITAFGTVDSAVTALRERAFDFIQKPFDQTEFLAAVEKARLARSQRNAVAAPAAAPEEEELDPARYTEIVRERTQSAERDLISKALSDNDGNVTRTADKLGLSRKGLQLKMKELGIRRS